MRVIPGTPDEIVLPETKPETEWLGGRAVRKMSPTRSHARLQARLVILLEPWAHGRGEVGTEWRVRLSPFGEIRRPLVPDVSYVSYERLRGHTAEQLELPDFAPDVAFEVRSKGESRKNLEEKIRVYLACGSRAVVIVDPLRRSVRTVDAGSDRTTIGDGVFAHAALPGFAMPLADLFSALDVPPAVERASSPSRAYRS